MTFSQRKKEDGAHAQKGIAKEDEEEVADVIGIATAEIESIQWRR